MRAPAPYRAQDSYLDQEESKDQTLEPDRAVANDNGSSTPPAPKPYQPPAPEGVSAARPVAQQPTFSQMQAAGEARPPMPESAPDPSAGPTGPISTLSGDWQAPTASANSAPLIASASGGTMTPQGDLANTFRGYESADGGTFGQADTGDRSQALRALESISGVDSGTTYANGVYGGGDPTKFGLGANATSADITALSRQNGLIANGDPAAIKAALTSPNPWLRANAEREAAKHPELLQPGAVSRLQGNATAQNPAEQEALLAQMASGEIPSGPQAYTPPSAAPQAAPPAGPVATPEVFKPAPAGSVITTQTGGQNTGPSAAPTQGGQSGTPSSFDILGTLMKGAGGQGAGSDVQNATQQSILEQLKNPSAYGSKEVQDAYDWLGGNIDDEYALRERQLKEDMSRRGLSDSTINAGYLKDLNIGKRSAKMGMGYDLAQKLAESKQSATGQAISQGLQGGQSAQNAQLDWLRNLIGYGQQGFENDMSTAKFNASQDQDWRDFLTQMLGAGYAGGG